MNVSHDCFLLPILIVLGSLSTSAKMMEDIAREIFTECVCGGFKMASCVLIFLENQF